MKKKHVKKLNLTSDNLITFFELCYPKTYQNASVKCHSVNETRSFVDIFQQYLYQQS